MAAFRIFLITAARFHHRNLYPLDNQHQVGLEKVIQAVIAHWTRYANRSRKPVARAIGRATDASTDSLEPMIRTYVVARVAAV